MRQTGQHHENQVFSRGAGSPRFFLLFVTRRPRSDGWKGLQKKIKNPLTATSVMLIFLRMKLLRSSLATLIAAGLSANAQPTTATTDPVGFVSYTVNANSDQKLGVPMQQASVFQGAATTVSGTSVSASGVPSLTGANFVVVTSGTANGKWEQIASSTSGSVTLSASISGFANGDSFEIKPFWTLGTLFPNGGAVPASPDVFDAKAVVLLNNPSATGVNIPPASFYLYHGGSVDYPAGWYDANDPDAGLQNNLTLSPEVSLGVRNSTGSPVSISFVGSVPTNKFALDIVRSAFSNQDNLVYNKFPADVTLGDSDLALSGAVSPSADVFDPGDLVLFYALNNSGANPAPSAFYFYHTGSDDYVAGWYDANDPDTGLKNSVLIPAGAPIVIRKKQGPASTVSWNPSTPYTLQ